MIALMLAAVTTGVCFSHTPAVKVAASPSVLLASYPHAASVRGIDGEARVACRIDTQGAVGNCKVLREAPSDVGFGEAAISVVRHTRFYPAISCGKATAAEYTASIRFRSDARGGSVD